MYFHPQLLGLCGEGYSFTIEEVAKDQPCQLSMSWDCKLVLDEAALTSRKKGCIKANYYQSTAEQLIAFWDNPASEPVSDPFHANYCKHLSNAQIDELAKPTYE